MRTLRALVAAQALSAWNRTVRESGLGGPAATAAILMVVALVLAVPGFITMRAGWLLGRRLASDPDPESLLLLTALQTLFTVFFAALGAFRHRLAFSRQDLGAYPISPATLLAAEVPAGTLEVFPILGALGIVCSNLGLAVAMPRAVPLVAVVAAQGVLWMLLLQHLLGSLKRYAFKRPLRVAVVATMVILPVVLALVIQGGDPRPPLRAAVAGLIPFLPGSQGYAAVVDLLGGHFAPALVRLAYMVAATGALVACTAWVHWRETRVEAQVRRRRRSAAPVLRFRTPAAGVAALHLRQLLDSRNGKVFFFVPLLMSGSAALWLWMMRFAERSGEALPEDLAGVLTTVQGLPLFEIFLFVVIWLNGEIWTNHFGWDRGGLRALLVLPLSHRQLLVGKLQGILRFTALQVAVCAIPLLFLYRPGATEVVGGLAAAGATFVVVTSGGQLLSIRFPRAVSRTSSATMPIYLSWIPGVAMVVLAGATVLIHRVTSGMSPWAAPVVFLILLTAAVVAYLRALPLIGAYLASERQRLLGM